MVPVELIGSVEDLVRQGPSQEGLFDPQIVLQIARRILRRYRMTYDYRKPYILGEKYHALDIAM